jgi:hypothetical protein
VAGINDEAKENRYEQVVSRIFKEKFVPGQTEVPFDKGDVEQAALALGIKNIPDIVYSFRYRSRLPKPIRDSAPTGTEWIIRGVGGAQYRFVAVPPLRIEPNPSLAETRIPDATPGLIARYARGDEQALLAKLRYNRLIDIFLGIACYSLQSHLKTSVKAIGSIEVDELYVGVDRRGAHYVVPVEAKGGKDRIGRTQIEQDIAFCQAQYPSLVCRPVAAQFRGRDDLIALFEFEEQGGDVRILQERHYRLVPYAELSAEELEGYRLRAE